MKFLSGNLCLNLVIKISKYKIFKNADLFINASLWEGLPNALVQSINYNVYPICSDAPGGNLEVIKNGEFHKNSDIPKLFINADPGSILIGEQREFVRTWNNLEEITVKGNHFIQEHSPNEIGKALSEFLNKL